MDLEGANIFQIQPLGRLAKIPAELRNRADVGSLGRRRHVPDRHVLDHAATKRAQLGHRWLLSEGWASTSTSFSGRNRSTNLAGHAALAASFNPKSPQHLGGPWAFVGARTRPVHRVGRTAA